MEIPSQPASVCSGGLQGRNSCGIGMAVLWTAVSKVLCMLPSSLGSYDVPEDLIPLPMTLEDAMTGESGTA